VAAGTGWTASTRQHRVFGDGADTTVSVIGRWTTGDAVTIDVLAAAGPPSGGSTSTSGFIVFGVVAVVAIVVMIVRSRRG
jgi:hypothetical protein